MDDDCAFVKAKPEGFYDIVSTRDTIEGGIEVIPADKVRRLVEALKWLLNDTQHADHNCGDNECPVDNARQVLKEFREL
jgi:hypothetical protein